MDTCVSVSLTNPAIMIKTEDGYNELCLRAISMHCRAMWGNYHNKTINPKDYDVWGGINVDTGKVSMWVNHSKYEM